MTKSTRARYTLEFKEEAVRLVTGGVRWTPLVRQLAWRVKREVPAGSLRRVDARDRCRREPQGNRYLFRLILGFGVLDLVSGDQGAD